MSENGANNVGDTDMADCDGEKVVTMMDVLQEQQDFEDDANAVLGASDEKNCTYSKGYIKRQAIYACLTCCSEAKDDPTKRAGVCLACSLNCHENHELIELYTKRNFRCDCGNPKFNYPCQYTPNKDDFNMDNKYNQNFAGLYCNCHRPYPDPEAPEEDEMIQCIICEDWLHASHLEAVVPGSEQYSEMVCKACMDDNDFLHDYTDLAVNVDREVDVGSFNDTDVKIPNGDDQAEKIENGVTEKAEKPTTMDVDKADAVNDTTTENVENHDTEVTEGTMETEKTETSQSPDINSENTVDDNAKQDTNSNSAEDKTENPPDNNLNTDSNLEADSNEDLKIESTADLIADSNEDLKVDSSAGLMADSTSDTTKETLDEHKDNSDNPESIENAKEPEDNLNKNLEEEESKSSDDNKSSEEINTETTSNIETCEKNDDEITNDTSDNKQESIEASEISEETKPITEEDEPTTNNIPNIDTNGQTDSHKNKSLTEENRMDETKTELSNETDMNGDKQEDIPKDSSEENKIPDTSDTETTELKENKRKLPDEEEIIESSVKKPRLDESQCSRPKGVKRLHKGAVFWPSNFRQKLCTCCECLAMYKDLSVLFLIDPEDTVSAYETLGKDRVDHTTQYEKGLEALSSLDRIQQINALTEYNKMRDKLLDYLKSFKDRKEVVKEEDIKAFFAGMKPKREPDGVYFCR